MSVSKKNSNPAVNTPTTGLEIAVIGMAGRFPGARNIHEFWENLKNGIETITFFSDEELEATGIDLQIIKNPGYVKAKGVLEGMEFFDSSFFSFIPPEAEIMDPQLRIFFECAWHALEDAGYNPDSYGGLIGLYAGKTDSFYWQAKTLLSGKNILSGGFKTALLNTHFCTLVSYHLNLKGPSLTVHTACSTSLVAIHTACMSLLGGECKMALAGGASVSLPQKSGYLYQEGMIYSPDGHTRSFDEQARGSVFGDGVGVVVLKRLKNALEDRDFIYAVIKGTVVNNDGIRKVGYTAPSVEGQAEALKSAYIMAEIEPESIGCIETHGTATELGDPVEIEALKMVFQSKNCPKDSIAIGSVKTNVGHLNVTAGITGLIKMVLALKYRLIPPTLHFEAPNHRIDFTDSPFFVNNRLMEWKTNGYPRRVGVSSFGIGGTNAHVILEEAPEGTRGLAPLSTEQPPRQHHLILLSAKTELALEEMTENLVEYFKDSLLNHGNHENPVNPGLILADTAYTLQLGRRTLPYRRMTVCPDVDSAIDALSSPGSSKVKTSHAKEEKRSVVFMFPGLGSEYVDMGSRLYQTEPVYREQMNHCFEILKSIMEYDMKAILYPGETGKVNSKPSPGLHQPEVVQPALFIFEYALARLLMHWGIKPRAMIGYSLGEYTAACLSGVFSLEDALKVIVTRGRLIGKIPGGKMIGVPLPLEQIKPFITAELSIAIDNGPSCIVSGPDGALEVFQDALKKQRCMCIPLPNTHAIHSPMMKSILEDFKTYLEKISLNNPRIPYVSNVTGDWITPRDAADPRYWTIHLKETVRFADGIQLLMKEPNPVFIEIGPGRDLNTLLVRHKQGDNQSNYRAVNLIKPARNKTPDDSYFLNKLGQLWIYGVNIDWKEFYKGEQRYRIPLPLYPFERQRYWIDIDPFKAGETMMASSLTRKKPDRADWFYTQQWLRSTLAARGGGTPAQSRWLLFIDDSSLGNRLVKRLEDENHYVVVVKTGESFNELELDEYAINPGNPGDYDNLFKRLVEAGKIPRNIVHLWCLAGARQLNPGKESLGCILDMGLYSLLDIARAIGNNSIPDEIQLGVITGNMQYVTGEEELYPGKAAVLGPVKIIPLEYSNISCRSIDIIDPGENSGKIEFIMENLIREFSTGFKDQPVIAYRGAFRWQETFEPVKLDLNQTPPRQPRLKEKGVYLVTGGFGGMGFVLAEHLVKTLKAKLILVDILTPPTGEKLDKWLYSDERKKEIREKKQKMEEWESLGAEIQVHDVDISDYRGMKEVISKAEEQFGKINGVIHTAGLIDYAGVIRRRTREMTGELLAAKIKGTLVLDELLGHGQLDFMVLFSSIGNVLYKIKFGQVGYNAGHEFLDVFSFYKQQQGRYTVTIDWNDWTEVGMAIRAANKRNAGSSLPGNSAGSENILSISPAEGIDVFRRIVENNINRVVVSHRDIHRLMEFISNPAREGAQTPALGGTSEKTAALNERPGISTEYEPPTNELEQFIIGIWEQTLGIKKIGITDDWFDLGGDSLIVTQVISRIREVYPLEISLDIFFENPTIAQLAEMIKELLYEKVRDLSEEELDALTEQDIL
jgi:acyl transferase domain-containing protein/acyl carrier protein